eukprot:6825291-Prymnesium_polylepis.2
MDVVPQLAALQRRGDYALNDPAPRRLVQQRARRRLLEAHVEPRDTTPAAMVLEPLGQVERTVCHRRDSDPNAQCRGRGHGRFDVLAEPVVAPAQQDAAIATTQQGVPRRASDQQQRERCDGQSAPRVCHDPQRSSRVTELVHVATPPEIDGIGMWSVVVGGGLGVEKE